MSDIKTSSDIKDFDKIKVRSTFKGNILSLVYSAVIRNSNLFLAFIFAFACILFYPVKPAFPGNT